MELSLRKRFERDLVFHGLVGIYDPPRPESRDSVLVCQFAGIAIHMLTGNHPQTAHAIATDVCILLSSEKIRMLPDDIARTIVMTAQEFDALGDDQIDALPQLSLVIASRMIEVLHRSNRYVAMTGGGVDDNLSFKLTGISTTI